MNSLDGDLIPILVKVQRLQARLLTDSEHFAAAWNWVDAFLKLEHGESPYYRMLRQAMSARRALLLIDGLDEAGAKREEIERHVSEVLAPQGHVLLATSRSAGASATRFQRFHRVSLSPLSTAQQRAAVEQRLGLEQATKLMAFINSAVPQDPETQQLLTANPLMLSMVASIFELRVGNGMPQTLVGLYDHASKAMLMRAGVAEKDEDLTPLLQACFYQAHLAKQREITAEHINAAAQQLPGSGRALELLMARIRTDRMPLLSLLQTEPLRLQAAHLSFQEYFAACAIREGLSGSRPWQWDSWWTNTVMMGSEMGV
eukprot:7016391-Prymnesium_polylepis.1